MRNVEERQRAAEQAKILNRSTGGKGGRQQK